MPIVVVLVVVRSFYTPPRRSRLCDRTCGQGFPWSRSDAHGAPSEETELCTPPRTARECTAEKLSVMTSKLAVICTCSEEAKRSHDCSKSAYIDDHKRKEAGR